MGIVSAAGAITFIILAPIAGRLIDRFGAIRLLIGADLWRAVVLGIFLTLGAVGFDQAVLAFFLPLMVLMAVGTSVGQPGIFALIPSLVPESDVRRANSTLITGRSVATILGPALSGVMVGIAGVWPSVTVNLMTFLASAAVLCTVTVQAPVSSPRTSHPTSTSGSTFRTISGRRSTLSAFGVALLGNLALSMYTVTLPLKFAGRSSEAETSSLLYGFTQAAFQVGMISVGLAMSRKGVNNVRTSSRTVASGLICMSIGMTVVGFVNQAPIIVAAGGLVGAALMFVSVISDPQLQLGVPAYRRGAVQGLVQGLGNALRPVGILLATTLFAIGGAELALLLAAVIVLSIALLVTLLNGYRDAVDPHEELREDANA